SGGGTSGGLIGTGSGGLAPNSYWDTETSGKSTSSGGLGRTTAQMTWPYDVNTFTGWNFINIWAADDDYTKNNGYPFLGYPVVYPSPDKTISNGQSSCYDGDNTVTVAGGGTMVKVRSGATLDVVADQRVLLLDGTIVLSGGHLHAWIEAGSGHCGESQAKMTEAGNPDGSVGFIQEELQTSALARIFPNPGSGLYTLEFRNSDPARVVSVEICTMTGILTGSYQLPGTGTYWLDLSGEASGLYFVRVMDLEKVQVIKVIKQ
ncbi:MAG: T9SS type A sorting domain-containing protein, partial [Bacteroidales bacterium]|nr:T9SS type A sorting domain-containing protein [Bacteroidales bacterium]